MSVVSICTSPSSVTIDILRCALTLGVSPGEEPALVLESWDGSPHFVSAEYLVDLGWQHSRTSVEHVSVAWWVACQPGGIVFSFWSFWPVARKAWQRGRDFDQCLKHLRFGV